MLLPVWDAAAKFGAGQSPFDAVGTQVAPCFGGGTEPSVQFLTDSLCEQCRLKRLKRADGYQRLSRWGIAAMDIADDA